MNRYNLALLLLTLAVVPLFYVSNWLGALAVVAIYYLAARLANRDLDRLNRASRRFHGVAFKRRGDPGQVPSLQGDPAGNGQRGGRRAHDKRRH